MLCVTSNKLKLAKFLSVFYAIDRLGESLLPVIGANLNLTLI